MMMCEVESLEGKIKTFSGFGATGNGGITRLCFEKADIEARAEFCKRCKALGLEISYDDMGSIYATLEGAQDLPAITMGSHLDSIRNGGNYDGVLGVLTGLEVLETMKKNGYVNKHPLKLIVWTNEEGARFEPSIMSSGVIANKFLKEEVLASTDEEGVTFGEALKASGYEGAKENRLNPEQTKAYVELHIEQGPVLESEKKEIGIVEGVLGMVTYDISLTGVADHAGTTPMKYRKDALLAAAQILLRIHEKLDQLDEELVYTTGRIHAHPNIHTVIPDEVTFSLDARHKNPEVIKQVVEAIESLPAEIAKCSVTYKKLWARDTVKFAAHLVDIVEKAAEEFGYESRKIYSGAGHDAQFVAEILPGTMIFVPSVDGHSHCENEYTSAEDCTKGANVLLHTILSLDKE